MWKWVEWIRAGQTTCLMQIPSSQREREIRHKQAILYQSLSVAASSGGSLMQFQIRAIVGCTHTRWAPKHIPGVSTFVAVVVVRFEEGGRGLCWRKKKGLVGIPEILPKGELKCAKECTCTWRHRKAQHGTNETAQAEILRCNYTTRTAC